MIKPIPKIPSEEALFKTRGFESCPAAIQTHLEQVGVEFLAGYALARESSIDETIRVLSDKDPQWRGFGFEGAALAYALYDLILPWGSRWKTFTMKADEHVYVCHIALGWAMGKAWPAYRFGTPTPDPLLDSLVYDGFGFVTGYFKHKKWLHRGQPLWLRGHRKNAYDQGLGRSLWFSCGAQPDRIAATIGRLGAERAPDLWAGVGLAAAYAGGVEEVDYRSLFQKASAYQGHLAQGAAFGSEARIHGSILMPHTDLACRVLSGLAATDAAAVARRTRERIDPSGGHAEYEKWRRLTREGCAASTVALVHDSTISSSEQRYEHAH